MRRALRDRGALGQHVDDQPFHKQGEAAFALSPRHFDLHHAVLRAVHSRNPCAQERLELARVQMTPCPWLGMITASQIPSANRARRSDSRAVLNSDVHPPFDRVQFNNPDKPWLGQAENPRIQVRVLNGSPPGSTLAGQLPTEKPEGPAVITAGKQAMEVHLP